ncbi:MAG: hemolysin activation/secretion protein [Flavobacteriales bacterium]|jgi:hemolysin activation/secretion protein
MRVAPCLKDSLFLVLFVAIWYSPFARAQAHIGASVLPPLKDSDYLGPEGLHRGEAVFISDFKISGNKVISSNILSEELKSYLGRYVSYSELSQIRDRLTLAYVKRGYVSSGAKFPIVNDKDGILIIDIVEGVLADVQIEYEGRLSKRYFQERLPSIGGAVVNIISIEKKLQLLQHNKRINRVQSSLLQGETPGESILSVKVSEAKAVHLSLKQSNHQSPNTGSNLTELVVEHQNLSGRGDLGRLAFAKSSGSKRVHGFYDIPVSSRDASIYIDGLMARNSVIEAPFDALNIKSQSDKLSLGLNYPIVRTKETRFTLFSSVNYLRSKSFLLGSPFSFSAGVENGEAKIAAVKFGHDLQVFGESQAIAFRSTLSVGLDAFGATSHEGDNPDGQFVKLLFQAQFARYFSQLDGRLVLRSDIQIANKKLLGLEKFSNGGHAGVRGYRENSLLTDTGMFASLEWRQSLWRKGNSTLTLVPFVDAGYGEDEDKVNGLHSDMSSTGLGLIWDFYQRGSADVFWAKPLKTFTRGDDLQDKGLHFNFVLTF